MDEREYLTIHIHVINPSKLWRGFSGEIDQGHLIESLEEPLDDLTIFVKLSPLRQAGILQKLNNIKDVKPQNIIPWESQPLKETLGIRRRSTLKRRNTCEDEEEKTPLF
jgi:hypothetical protein